jgi:hypothetical protein
VDEASFEELYRSTALSRYLVGEARRHFASPEDREDAIGLAWARILAAPAGEDFEVYKREGARAIRNAYQRALYRRKKSPEASIDAGGEGKPSSALAQLARVALEGDW